MQTPQFFRITNDQSWVERGAGAVQELFYRSIQTARSRKGGAICVGSCAVYRRAALKENLGMTLAEHSEDVLTGFDLNRIGWSLRYIPVALSTGNCPDNVPAFLNQQYRWCSGTVGLLFGKMFWGAKLPLYTRLCYISGFIYYIYTALFTFVVPALTIAILAFVPNVLEFKNMIFMVPVRALRGGDHPGVASRSLPARGVGRQADLRLGAFLRVLGRDPRQAAGLESLGRGQEEAGLAAGASGPGSSSGRWAARWLWTGLAFWRMLTMNPYNFIVLFGLGLFELAGRGAGAPPAHYGCAHYMKQASEDRGHSEDVTAPQVRGWLLSLRAVHRRPAARILPMTTPGRRPPPATPVPLSAPLRLRSPTRTTPAPDRSRPSALTVTPQITVEPSAEPKPAVGVRRAVRFRPGSDGAAGHAD